LNTDFDNSTLNIEIYADEIILPTDFNSETKNIIGIACLFVPLSIKEKLFSELVNNRCLFEESNQWCWKYQECSFSQIKGGQCKEDWHIQNMCEVHHSELRNNSSHSKKSISRNWLYYLMFNNKKNLKQIYFNILYVDLNKLRVNLFGDEKTHENIYNKFFRTVLDYGIKSYFPNKRVVVKNVFHDEGHMVNHHYFPHFNLKKLNVSLEDNTSIENTSIQFIDSDHRKYLKNEYESVKASHFVQLIDLILGAISQNIFYLSNDSFKKEIAMIIRPLVERLLKNPYNINSSYNYCKCQHISFFPEHSIDEAENILTNLSYKEIRSINRNNFYSNRKIEMPPYNPHQKTLDMWSK
jgi:hypothetical protein